jgi:hypothetical protein
MVDETARVKCDRCGREITEEESRSYLTETLCDDCYLDARYEAKACDPWAVYTATKEREDAGLDGTEGLTGLQKAIYHLVKNRGKVTAAELTQEFELTPDELQSQIAILRHCELLRGSKEGDKVYIVPFK